MEKMYIENEKHTNSSSNHDSNSKNEANQISIHNSLHKPKSFIGTLKDLAQDLTMLSSGFLFSEFKKHFLSFNINYLDPSKYTFFSKNQIGKDKLPEPDFTTYNSNKDLLDDFGPHPNADLIDFSKIKTYNKNPNLVLHTVNLVEEFNKYNKIQKERNKLLLNVDNTAELEDLDIVYKCEKHKVLTKDGFVLLIFRIYAVCVNHEHNKYEFCDLNNDYSDDDSEDEYAKNGSFNIFSSNNQRKGLHKRNNSSAQSRKRVSSFITTKNSKIKGKSILDHMKGYSKIINEETHNNNNLYDENQNNFNNINEEDYSYSSSDNDTKGTHLKTDHKQNDNIGLKNNILDNIIKTGLEEVNVREEKYQTTHDKYNKKSLKNNINSINEQINDQYFKFTENSEKAFSKNKFRFIRKLNKNCNRKKPILIQHGVADSSDSYFCNSEDKCIPLVLAKKGYDVWMANTRGNYYSEEHLLYDKNKYSKYYYDYSYDEMGRFDIPGTIQKIQSVRKNDTKISVLAHSQGGASMLAGMSFNNAYYSSKVDLFVALSPVTTLVSLSSKILKFMACSKVERVFSLFGKYSLGHRSQTISYLASKHLNNLTIKFGKKVKDLGIVNNKTSSNFVNYVTNSHSNSNNAASKMNSIKEKVNNIDKNDNNNSIKAVFSSSENDKINYSSHFNDSYNDTKSFNTDINNHKNLNELNSSTISANSSINNQHTINIGHKDNYKTGLNLDHPIIKEVEMEAKKENKNSKDLHLSNSSSSISNKQNLSSPPITRDLSTKNENSCCCFSKCGFEVDLSSVFFGLLTDKSSQKINDTSAINKFIYYNPSGTSCKSVIHFLYNYHSNTFSRFDYGRNTNLHLYHSSDAPQFLLEKITVPTLLIYGTYDRLSNEDDIDSIHSRMIDVVIGVKKFDSLGHLSYSCGKDFTWFNSVLDALGKIEDKNFKLRK